MFKVIIKDTYDEVSKEAFKVMKAVLDEKNMLVFSKTLKRMEKNRLNNLVDADRECTALKRFLDIGQLRLENRLIKN